MLRRSVELTVISGHLQRKKRRPLNPRQRLRKQTCANGHVRFAPKADLCSAMAHVCYGPIADMSMTQPSSGTAIVIFRIIRSCTNFPLAIERTSTYIRALADLTLGVSD